MENAINNRFFAKEQMRNILNANWYELPSLVLVICFLFTSIALYSQNDSLPVINSQQDIIEDFIDNADEEGEFTFDTQYEHLEHFRQNPINLNKTNYEQLQSLGLLDDVQIKAFLKYRKDAGELIAIYELQAIPSWDLSTINRVLPFLKISGGIDNYNIPLGQLFYKGKNQIFLRTTRILEEQEGYKPIVDGGSRTKYVGDQNRYYARFKHVYENRFSYGITLEKDPGEAFFSDTNKLGFDYISAHLYAKDLHPNIKAVALGDFSVNMGQGLLMYQGFGGGKSSFVMNIKRSSRPLKGYTSVNEYAFMRGGGATLAFKNIEFTAFSSYQSRGGNILFNTNDTIDDAEIQAVSSFQLSGFHRTPSEIEDKKALHEWTSGGILKYSNRHGHFAINALNTHLDVPLKRSDGAYNQFRFQGSDLLNFSADYSYLYQNIHFFGETGWSDNGAWATTNGLLIGLDRTLDFALSYRNFQRNFQTLYGSPFAETSQGSNERGLYTALQWKPNRYWTFVAYSDIWRHPWFRFGIDSPSGGYEYMGRLTYSLRRKMTAYIQFKSEIKQHNSPDNTTKSDFLVEKRRSQLRVHLSQQISKDLSLRYRIEGSLYNNGAGEISKGYMILQDVVYKPKQFPLSLTTRLALFNTDGYNSRIYAYENDVLYSFSIPAYYNQGTRFYLNLRYRGIRKMVIEARLARTDWFNKDSFGSGLEKISAPHRTEVKFQLKYSF